MIAITAFIKSKRLKVALTTLAAIIALLFIFKAGEVLGEHKARFSYRWGENYHRTVGGHPFREIATGCCFIRHGY